MKSGRTSSVGSRCTMFHRTASDEDSVDDAHIARQLARADVRLERALEARGHMAGAATVTTEDVVAAVPGSRDDDEEEDNDRQDMVALPLLNVVSLLSLLSLSPSCGASATLERLTLTEAQ